MPDSSIPSPAEVKPVVVREVPIELCQFVKFAGLAGTGGEAKHLIGAGQVRVNGVVEIRKRRKLVAGDVVQSGGRAAVVRLGA
ncbi:MAG TPA: RNA-binding S4 domain-containing protein [Lacunisphaera sp.]|nr:RNA-binding S4 domain-containing protein [Lacunisphaera sp.]